MCMSLFISTYLSLSNNQIVTRNMNSPSSITNNDINNDRTIGNGNGNGSHQNDRLFHSASTLAMMPLSQQHLKLKYGSPGADSPSPLPHAAILTLQTSASKLFKHRLLLLD
jgi:hypothetical protein